MLYYYIFLLIILSSLPLIFGLDTLSINKILLNEHNKYRKMHGVPNLELDNSLITKAVAYAESLAKNSNDNFLEPSNNYEGDEKLGENLFQCNKKTCKMENYTQPLEVWYKEKNYYNFNTNKGEKGTANFTQMVWKSTKKLGCGLAQKYETSYKVVCYYLPKGNIAEKYDINVLPVKEQEDKKGNGTSNETASKAKEYKDYNDYITDDSFNIKYTKFFCLGLFLALMFV